MAVVAILALAGVGAVLGSLPATALVTPQPAISAAEHQAALEALRPPKRQRPVVALIAINNATETTDFIVPTSILRRAGVADVLTVATAPGPVQLYPALTVEADTTTTAFDAAYPEGADYVIVPAMSPDNDPVALAWINKQAESGAIIIGVCIGARVVSEAGLLDGKRATTHWFALRDMLKRHPTIESVADRRFVVDGNVVTTTGITASMPTMLTLIEAIAGSDRARAVADELGIDAWDARHDSGAFQLTRPFVTTVVGNVAALWNREEFGIPVADGIDEVTLALTADAWSRTYRSNAISFSPNASAITSRNGIRILPDRVTDSWASDRTIAIGADQAPAAAFDQSLEAIGQRYGAPTADVVAMQLEYDRSANPVQKEQ
jgi:transcriptional regulator GlxA family with amidase domain